MDRIQIRNLGPIREVDLEIRDFMIFIGPNASGKSTISKVVYVFYYFKYLFSSITDNNINFIKDDSKDNTKEWDIFASLGITEETFISCQYFKDSQPLLSLIINPGVHNDIDRFKVLCNYEFENLFIPIFIPSGRILSSILPKINYNLIGDFTYSIHDINVKGIKNLYHHINSEQLEKMILTNDYYHTMRYRLATELSHSILKGKYSSLPDADRLSFNDINYIDIENASSGQQSSLWISNLISFFFTIKKSSAFFLEEPEAHLFPEAQKQIVELISLFSSTTPGNQVMITTHSPYILSATNNLLYAYRVGQKKPEEVAKVIDPLLWLDPKRVGAYFVDNGTIRSIMDDELEMIKTEEIDNVSRILNDQFDQIFALEEIE
ncbi:MAG: AAA family ATPase [Magnetococcus sp. YQC-5]